MLYEVITTLPLTIWEETPILFGEAKTEQIGETKVIHADLVAGTFFLITRYEEVIRRDVRDVHGRFPGKESLPYRAGFIDRPLVEEYGKLLRSQMREVCCDIPEPPRITSYNVCYTKLLRFRICIQSSVDHYTITNHFLQS